MINAENLRESELFHRIEGIVRRENGGGNPQPVPRSGSPPGISGGLDCATYTASLRDMVFQRKPDCPNHDPRWELALLADHRYQAVMQGIRAAGGRGDNQVDLFGAEARDRQQAIGRKLADVEGGRDRE
jgi:hypothetical protein